MSETVGEKAAKTREENQRFVNEVVDLPFPEQSARVEALPPARKAQVLAILLKRLLATHSKNSKEAQAAFRESLPVPYKAALQRIERSYTRKAVASLSSKASPTKKQNSVGKNRNEKSEAEAEAVKAVAVAIAEPSLQIQLRALQTRGYRHMFSNGKGKVFLIDIVPYLTADELHQVASDLATEARTTEDPAARKLSEGPFKDALLKRVQARMRAKKAAEAELRDLYGLNPGNTLYLPALQADYAKNQERILAGPGSFEAKRKELQALAETRKGSLYRPLAFTTPLVDTLGYHQSDNTCVPDSIQQILLFGDPWKDKVQPFFYNATKEQLETLVEERRRCGGLQPDPASFVKILDLMAQRFRSHYNMIRYQQDEVCVLPFEGRQVYERKFEEYQHHTKEQYNRSKKDTHSPDLARQVKQHMLDLHKNAIATYSYATHFLTHMVRVLLGADLVPPSLVCFWRYTTYYYKADPLQLRSDDVPYTGFQHLAFLLYSRQTLRYTATQHTLVPTAPLAHVTAIYRSGAAWHYYDNEQGIRTLPLELMKDILNETMKDAAIGFAYREEENDVMFYKIPYYHGKSESVVSSKVAYKWAESEWVPIRVRDIEASVFIFVQTIHIATNDARYTGFKGTFADDQFP